MNVFAGIDSFVVLGMRDNSFVVTGASGFLCDLALFLLELVNVFAEFCYD